MTMFDHTNTQLSVREHADRAQADAAQARAPRAVDPQSVDAFVGKMLGAYNGGALMLMTSIGYRTGLFDTMADMPPATSHEIAQRAELSERYVREWLGAMTASGVVRHEPAAKTYHLPPEHAAVLTRDSNPNCMAIGAQFFAVLGAVEDEVVEAFRHGRGVPYSAYRNFHRVMAEESYQTVVSALEPHIIPLMGDHWRSRLEAGIDVLDVGCGAGRALCKLGRMFPNSRFVGVDFEQAAIDLACGEARQAGVENVEFRVADAARLDSPDSYDLILAFDAIHDQARPAEVLSQIRSALRKGAMFFMQDIQCSSHHHGDKDHVMGTFIYTISCMHCMSVSLANGGPGLGAAWGKEVALRMLADAGFGRVDVKTLPHDPQNYYYLCQA